MAFFIQFTMKIFDLHSDILTEEKNEKKITKHLTKNKNIAITLALWTTKLSQNTIEEKLNQYKTLASTNSNIKLAIEDFCFAQNFDIQNIIELKPLYVGLTWNKDNALAGGCEGCGHLSDLGEDYIKALNQNKIVVDTAHLNEKSFMEVANAADEIICSHTAFSGVFDHKRNLKDYQIKMIIDRGGIIGFNLVSHFLSPNKKSDKFDVLRHIEYFIDKYGDDNLSLGTDYFGSPDIVKSLNSYKKLEGIEKELKKIGYSEETIAKIFYQNAERYFNGV